MILPLEALGLLLEVGEPLEDDFEGAAGLAGLDHVDVEPVEALRVLAERLGEGRAGLDVVDDVDRAFLSTPGFICRSRIRRLRSTGRPASWSVENWRVKVHELLAARRRRW